MTLQEAQKVAEVLARVDGRCSECTRDAAEDMADRFPEFPWVEMVEKARRWDFGGWPESEGTRDG